MENFNLISYQSGKTRKTFLAKHLDNAIFVIETTTNYNLDNYYIELASETKAFNNGMTERQLFYQNNFTELG